MASTRTIGIKRGVIVWIAAYLVALHAIVAAFATVHMLAAGGTALVICHGGSSQTSGASGDDGRDAPISIGFTCGLCAFAGATAIVPPGIISVASGAFARLLHETAIETDISVRPARDGFSRAPPRLA